MEKWGRSYDTRLHKRGRRHASYRAFTCNMHLSNGSMFVLTCKLSNRPKCALRVCVPVQDVLAGHVEIPGAAELPHE